MKKAIIIQPGKLGDILITAPIADYYHNLGYLIDWPVFNNFSNVISRLGYANEIFYGINIDNSKYYSNKRTQFWEHGKRTLNEINPNNRVVFDGIEMFNRIYDRIDTHQYDLVIDPCFSFPGHRNVENNQKTSEYASRNLNWINLKYDLVSVPLNNRWNLNYTRNLDKEQQLLEFVRNYSIEKYGSDKYSIIHTYCGLEELSKKTNAINPINFSYIHGYEIFDWRLVLENSDSIVCCDSSLCNYVEVLPSLRETKKFYLGSEEIHYHPYMRNILLNNWTNLTKEDISYGNYKVE